MARLTISFGPKSEDTLSRLSEQQEASRIEIVRRAIGLYAFLSEEARNGNRIVLERPDGTIREIAPS